MRDVYDAIVVGARCAGSPLAMLLARRGHRVLLLERARFPSDTVSTHYIHQPGVARLKRWGLLDRLRATGCPPIVDMGWDIEGIRFVGRPPTPDGVVEAFGPRRTVLDEMLARAAEEAGAELREAFTVKEIVREDGRVVGIRGRARGGAMVEERARVVVGADGLRSTVAREVGADRYERHSPRTHAYYTYWDGVGLDRLDFYGLPGLGAAAFPTNDGLAMVSIVFSTFDYPDGVRGDIEGNYLAGLQRFRSLAEKVLAGKRVERFAGMHRVPNRFRRSAGSGWALVGDAGYHKDPAAAQGITDAFRDAEALAEAIDRGLSDPPTLDAELETYARTRDEAV
ncbi:MAG TPA: NAD(P)/FAD-dependent oxidoreductase, partial [Actinomycetota bacterium]|nr:NAD(P)/FAD-dependent oxidoreductase [Actinomycetota bacterium]